MPWIALMIGRIMKGSSTWVSAMTMPSPLYISGNGPSVSPQIVRVRLITPAFPSSTVQP